MKASVKERDLLSPPEVSRLWGVDKSKVHAWIAAGELQAMDFSTSRNQRPRYLISREAMADFMRRRAVVPKPEPAPRRKRAAAGVTEFF